ncbi:hypothetical protein HHK36_031355 [Tetracentron sinense]|uniref:Phosphofructokinase domain-containing protein n=1 Tax=Tetracentron sinense TaxID=13715 RepID=A0A835D1M8_TETSI|nr:hypothetical protein HHK36_031355 [Tetracentron sinense]
MDSDFGNPRELSDLQKQRSFYEPVIPPCLQGTAVRVEFGDATIAADSSGAHTISRSFPNTVGLVFCGRQSPGGHNVIWGLHNALKIHNSNSTLFGFLAGKRGLYCAFPSRYLDFISYCLWNLATVSLKLLLFVIPTTGGTEGLFAQKTLEVTDDILSTYKNQGGYDMLGRTKDQIRTTEQVNAALNACKALKLDGLVIVGGVTSNTDAAQLAETFAEAKCSTKVVGVPVTLNGDLKNQFVEANVGFDTISKVSEELGILVNSQLISNVCTDALSAEKVVLGEEVASSKLTLFDLTKQICDAVQARAEQDKYHGVILLPEGLIESIPEVYALLQVARVIKKYTSFSLFFATQEIHNLHRQGVYVDNISSQLLPWASALLEFLPPFIKKQLLLHPESDDSAQLSQIETEKLLAHLVETEMNKRLVGAEGALIGEEICSLKVSDRSTEASLDDLAFTKTDVPEEISVNSISKVSDAFTVQNCSCSWLSSFQHGGAIPTAWGRAFAFLRGLEKRSQALDQPCILVGWCVISLISFHYSLFSSYCNRGNLETRESVVGFVKVSSLEKLQGGDLESLCYENQGLIRSISQGNILDDLTEKKGTYKGKKFNAICHFFGYQARGSLPSKFDCDYAYVLGHICYHILAAGLNGYMATVTNLKNPVNKWRCGAAPITAMMTVKQWSRGPRVSIGKPAVHPATVDLKGKAYELLRQNAMKFLLEDVYRNPGPLQFDGPGADSKTVTLSVEDQDYMGRIKKLQEYLDKVRNIVKPGCSQDVLKAALSSMASVTDVLSLMSAPSISSQTPKL